MGRATSAIHLRPSASFTTPTAIRRRFGGRQVTFRGESHGAFYLSRAPYVSPTPPAITLSPGHPLRLSYEISRTCPLFPLFPPIQRLAAASDGRTSLLMLFSSLSFQNSNRIWIKFRPSFESNLVLFSTEISRCSFCQSHLGRPEFRQNRCSEF